MVLSFKKNPLVFLAMVITGLTVYGIGYNNGSNAGGITIANQSDLEQIIETKNHINTDTGCLNSDGLMLSAKQYSGFLNVIEQAVSKTLQKQLQQNPNHTLVYGNPVQNKRTEQASQYDVETVRQAVENTNILLDEAILQGYWGLKENNQLFQTIKTLPPHEFEAIQKKLANAINEGQLKFDIEDILQLSQ